MRSRAVALALLGALVAAAAGITPVAATTTSLVITPNHGTFPPYLPPFNATYQIDKCYENVIATVSWDLPYGTLASIVNPPCATASSMRISFSNVYPINTVGTHDVMVVLWTNPRGINYINFTRADATFRVDDPPAYVPGPPASSGTPANSGTPAKQGQPAATPVAPEYQPSSATLCWGWCPS